ncbi:NRDE family protein [Flagellimonas zhangzhouensis]|uniref:Transport and Golgi organisation 2 n=1 Tax=Flagellimonas zhangzhouensis TaxID=1073328 RepID=A0A1H2XAW1_9FLAO|nr:NRDE family protein [Allomuricauda zhangzhouensis]SDQ30343.1 Transport and Golgi organisation 2 [Allomuricauda zhangzhouensis]SDW90072.1 Transport and Golgi organisation 2 [Allomuricauda zhangzhouensis]
MCTVSFVSSQGQYVITSNRDEHISRPLAHQPKEETIGAVKVLFPKDPKAGGTWFALNENGAVGVLLNGAFVNHQMGGAYAKSRGLILLDIISSENPLAFLKELELYQIEPFTLVLFDASLVEFRWDGNQKYFRPLDKTQNHIWASATLYSDETIQQRAQLFDKFQETTTAIGASEVLDFHSNNHNDFENGFIIDRESGLKTFSVTQAVLGDDQILMKHLDLLNDKVFDVLFSAGELTF